MAKPVEGLMKMVICPVCNRELPWLLPMDKAPWVLGIPQGSLEEVIEMDEIVVRVNLDNSPPTEVIDMRTVRTLPPRFHETMKHTKTPGLGRIRGSQGEM